MILNTGKFQEVCTDILNAINPNELSQVTEVIDIQNDYSFVYLTVAGGDYTAKFKFEESCSDIIHAVVDAKLFLKLVLKITTPTIELNIINDTTLQVKANGSYNLPLIFEEDKLLDISEIKLNNIVSEFDVSTTILKNIDKYNSIELSKAIFTNPVQKLYYVDNKGAITFTTGACVNNFNLPLSHKLLFNVQLVKLFKLFKSDNVKFKIAEDTITSDVVQTKVCIETNQLTVTAIINCSDALLNIIPVDTIRNLANDKYPNCVEINKELFVQTIGRIILFNDNFKHFNKVEFFNDKLRVYDCNDINFEDIIYTQPLNLADTYVTYFDMQEINTVISSTSGKEITLCFGNNTNIVVKATANVDFIIPECVLE